MSDLANCAYCRGQLHEANAPRCSNCQTRHHLECWKEFGGCIQMGCVNGPLAPGAQ